MTVLPLITQSGAFSVTAAPEKVIVVPDIVPVPVMFRPWNTIVVLLAMLKLLRFIVPLVPVKAADMVALAPKVSVPPLIVSAVAVRLKVLVANVPLVHVIPAKEVKFLARV